MPSRLGCVLALTLAVSPASAKDTCLERARALRSWMRLLADEVTYEPPPLFTGRTPLVSLALSRAPRAGARASRTALLLELNDREAVLGQNVARIKATGGSFASEIAAALPRARAPRGERSLVVAVEPGTAWGRVVAVTEAARSAGFTAVELLFHLELKKHPAPPGPSSIDGELGRIRKMSDPAAKTRSMRAIFQRLTRRCPRVRKAFPISRQGPQFTVRWGGRWMDVMLPECRCALDIGAFRSYLWALFRRAPTMVVELKLPPGRRGRRTVSARSSARWGKVFGRVVKAAESRQTVVFRVRGD